MYKTRGLLLDFMFLAYGLERVGSTNIITLCCMSHKVTKSSSWSSWGTANPQHKTYPLEITRYATPCNKLARCAHSLEFLHHVISVCYRTGFRPPRHHTNLQQLPASIIVIPRLQPPVGTRHHSLQNKNIKTRTSWGNTQPPEFHVNPATF